MKVLLLSLFHPELVRGGAQQICYELFEGLKAVEGVEPTLLAAIEPRFPALYKSGARITGFDNRPGEFLFLSRDYDYIWNKATNPLLIESYIEFLETVRPDVVHFHHFLLFGINLLPVTRQTLPEVRIVFTFHEFLSICHANGHMLRRSDNSLCTRASNVRCHQCFPEYGPEHFFLREMWMKRHLEVVDVFTCPSRFMIEHYVTWGLERAKIRHVTNGQRDYSGGVAIVDHRRQRNRFGFFGQMVDNKGVWVILRAVEQLRAEGFRDFTVEINGDNLRYASEARRKEFEDFMAVEVQLPFAERNVVFNGSYQVDELPQRMARIDWCLVPSTWWEIFGLVVSEAWMFGRPVIASNVGGPKERIRHDEDGLLFAVGDPRALADTIRRACIEDGLWDRLVGNIRPPATRDIMVDGYLEVYTDAAARPPAPPPVPAAAAAFAAGLPLPPVPVSVTAEAPAPEDTAPKRRRR
jgi:glycosyltransferase involved in cell wall biosynthesis